MDPATLSKVHKGLQEIFRLAYEIEQVPNLPQDKWTMQDIDKKALRVQKLAAAIARALGSGDVRPGDGGQPNSGDGGSPNTGDGF